MEADLKAILRRHWGYDSFRPMQEEAAMLPLEGRDVMVLMPTGGGKSVTFQVPGLALGGLTIVVTPLISLMKDQVDGLKRRGIKAVALHSGQTAPEIRIAWERLDNGRYNFLYLSPEKLASERMIQELKRMPVKLLVVDEAHCISQWGYDFRPSYLNIGQLRKELPGVPVMALTATATPRVEQDILEKLGMADAPVVRRSFSRENLSYIVRPCPRGDKEEMLLRVLRNTSGSAIVYVRSRRKTRLIAEALTRMGLEATYYHAGLDHEMKEERQNAWQQGRIRVMVATNAFGMGIDKADVRTVVHVDLPSSPEEYYQEAGRAGRDGKPAFAVLLTTERDKAVMKRRISLAFPDKEVVKQIYEKVCNNLGITVGEGAGRLYDFNPARFCELFKVEEQLLRPSLKILAASGYMELLEDTELQARLRIVWEREELYNLHGISESAERVLKAMLRIYSGLFSDYVFIDERVIAIKAGIEEKAAIEGLIELSRARIVSYIPRKRNPMISMLDNREESRHLKISRNAYEDRREQMEARANAMLDYAFNSDSCRVSRMLHYFGEEGAVDCGSCDVCRSRRKHLSIEERVLADLRRGLTLVQAERLYGERRDEAWRIVVRLEREGAVDFDGHTARLRKNL